MQKANQIISERQLIHVKINDLKFDKTNPNKLTEQQMDALNKSMQRFGYLTPIVIDQNNLIADGEHRALVYKDHGLKEIPAFKVNLKTDAERRMLRQVMNKLRGEHDRELDANELLTIFQAGQLDDLTKLIAQDKEDLQRLMLRYHPGLDFVTAENEAEIDKLIDDELKRKVPDTQLGDLYQLGNHRLVCGDCTDKRIIEKLLEDAKIHQLNTDPPFGVRLGDRNARMNERFQGSRLTQQYSNDNPDTDYRELFKNVFANLSRSFAEYNTVYVFSATGQLLEIVRAFSESGVHFAQLLVWVKQNHVLSQTDYAYQTETVLYGWKGKHKFYGGFRTNVLSYDREIKHEFHAAMRPTELIRQLITDGTQKGDNVLDAFTGSGSVVLAAEQTGRNAYCVEIDPHYCDVIVKRWEMYTGKKAVKKL